MERSRLTYHAQGVLTVVFTAAATPRAAGTLFDLRIRTRGRRHGHLRPCMFQLALGRRPLHVHVEGVVAGAEGHALHPGAGGSDDILHVGDDWAAYRTSASEVERRTGYRFFDRLAPEVADALRKRVDQTPVAAPRVRR